MTKQEKWRKKFERQEILLLPDDNMIVKHAMAIVSESFNKFANKAITERCRKIIDEEAMHAKIEN